MGSNAEKNGVPFIASLRPPAAISGGTLELRGESLSSGDGVNPVVRFGDARGRLVVGGSSRVVVSVPEDAEDGVVLLESNGHTSNAAPCVIGKRIAENLHPVANPAVDTFGNVYTTRSGARGEKVPVSVFKIDTTDTVRPFNSDIVNPTGLVIDSRGMLLVSARNEGTIYAVDAAGDVETYAEGMGIATGLAMDDQENLYVGDRTGTIFKIGRDRQIFVFATMEPSISAYHLAFGADGYLYVSGPTTSSHDSVKRVNAAGEVEPFGSGFGRPQGLAFDLDDRLYVAASHGGRRGVFRIVQNTEPELVVSGPGIVGLAFIPTGGLVVATTSNIYRLRGDGL